MKKENIRELTEDTLENVSGGFLLFAIEETPTLEPTPYEAEKSMFVPIWKQAE